MSSGGAGAGYRLLPELNELEEDAEVPESKKELEGEVEEPEGEEKELGTEPEPSVRAGAPLPEPDEEEREQAFQLMMEKLNSTLSRALERGQRRRRRR
jgi:hypothetical protein